jgi:hypothetical protein
MVLKQEQNVEPENVEQDLEPENVEQDLEQDLYTKEHIYDNLFY